jgi:hypothetical protein
MAKVFCQANNNIIGKPGALATPYAKGPAMILSVCSIVRGSHQEAGSENGGTN